MAEEHRTFCKYCNLDFADREYALHQLSNAHMKRIRVELLQCEFSGVCLVCKHGLKDLMEVENHVSSETHRTKYKARISSAYAITNNCTCELCAVSFHNQVALEAHRLMPLHRKTAHAYYYPKLDELLKQVSGLPGEELALHVTSLCSVCDVQLNSVDAYIMHLFTTAHISSLRYSKCFVCSKAFVHADNRESHLISSKHLSSLQKWSNSFKESCTRALLTKGGYPCMFCMIWCSSWLCLGLHLLYTHHAEAVRQSNQRRPVLAKMTFILPTNADNDDAGGVCDASHAQRWKEWKESLHKAHAWCHVCAIPLSNLDVVNEHLNMHETETYPSMLPKKHAAPQEVMDCNDLLQMFTCCVCALSFKSALVLQAHEACLGHHCRLANSLANSNLICCTNCGVMVKKEGSAVDDDKLNNNVSRSDVVGLEEARRNIERCEVAISSADCPSSYEELNRNASSAGVSKPGLSISYMKSSQGIQEKSVTASNMSIPMINNHHKIVIPHVCMQDESCVINPFHLKEERSPTEIKTTGDVPACSLIGASKVKIEKGADISQTNFLHTGDVAARKTTEVGCNDKSSACIDEGELKSWACLLQEADIKIPIVTAAALVPLGALQQSLQSMMNVVAQTLSKSLHRNMQNLAKRKQAEADNQLGSKKPCSTPKAEDYSFQSAHANQSFTAHTDSEQAKRGLGDVLHSYGGIETAELTTMDVWQTDALSPNPLVDSSAWFHMHDEAMIRKTKRVSATNGVDDVCKLADELIDIKTYPGGQSAKANEYASEKLDGHQTLPDGHQTLPTTLMQVAHINEIESSVKDEMGFKANEPPVSIIELDMSPNCIKSEKHIVDDDDSLNLPNNFKDGDLWWVLSDSEEGEISHKQQNN